MARTSSFSERPRSHRPRRLSDWLNPTGSAKVHSLVDKVYKPKNLELAWEKVKRNRGAGGVDGQSLEAFEAELGGPLARLHCDLKGDAYPREKSIQHFKDQIRQRTRRKAPVGTRVLIEQINPVIRGWGQYYCRAHVRRLFHRLDGWIVRRLWSHRHRRWRCRGWRDLPPSRLYGELGLVNLVSLIPSLGPHRR